MRKISLLQWLGITAGFLALLLVIVPMARQLRAEARDHRTRERLATLRGAVAIAAGAIAAREKARSKPASYPSYAEIRENQMMAAAPGNHNALSGLPIVPTVKELPANPWTDSKTVKDCSGMRRGTVLGGPDANDGWCYNASTGEVWANSERSHGGPLTENYF